MSGPPEAGSVGKLRHILRRFFLHLQALTYTELSSLRMIERFLLKADMRETGRYEGNRREAIWVLDSQDEWKSESDDAKSHLTETPGFGVPLVPTQIVFKYVFCLNPLANGGYQGLIYDEISKTWCREFAFLHLRTI